MRNVQSALRRPRLRGGNIDEIACGRLALTYPFSAVSSRPPWESPPQPPEGRVGVRSDVEAHSHSVEYRSFARRLKPFDNEPVVDERSLCDECVSNFFAAHLQNRGRASDRPI